RSAHPRPLRPRRPPASPRRRPRRAAGPGADPRPGRPGATRRRRVPGTLPRGLPRRPGAPPAGPGIRPPGRPRTGPARRRRYPYPVPGAYLRLTEAAPPSAEFGCLVTLFEALVHYLATVAVSAYLRTGLASADCNRHLLGLLLRGKWTTGLLLALLRDTVR